jgi:hypothetical protein
MANIHIARNQQTLGSFIEDEIREGLRTGRFAATDLVWREGMEGWKPLGEMAPQWGMELQQPLLETDAEASTVSIAPEALYEPAWEDRKRLGFFPAMGKTLRAVLVSPSQTFGRLKQNGGLPSPLLYAVLLNTMLHTLFGLIALASVLMMTPEAFQTGWRAMQEPFQQLQSSLPGASSPGLPSISQRSFAYLLAGSILIWPLLDMAAYFLGAGIMHVSLMVAGGAKNPFESTFRTVCYLCGSFNAMAIFLNLLPGGTIGTAISLVALCAYSAWYAYGFVIALKEAQGIEIWRVIIAAIAASVIACCLFMVVIALLSPLLAGLIGISAKTPLH